MPTQTPSDVAIVGQEVTSRKLDIASRELDTFWETMAEDRLASGRAPHERASMGARRIWWAIEFERACNSPGEARRKVVKALRTRGCEESLIGDAALVVTELAANAVVHARSSFSVCLALRDSTLRVDVADCGPIAPDSSGQDWVPRRGRGLGLIDALCTRWGADSTARGKIVWGELALNGAL